jgi:dihydrofolate reductase
MRSVRYSVAASLDGFIADDNGGYDWIPNDPTVDFGALFGRVDTVLLGRRSFDLVQSQGADGGGAWPPGTRVYVFSDTLLQGAHPGATIVTSTAAAETVAALRAEAGTGEVWLFGGGALFASLLAAGQVDLVEVTVVPVLLGSGVPLLRPGAGARRTRLKLEDTHLYPNSGMITLSYRVELAEG